MVLTASRKRKNKELGAFFLALVAKRPALVLYCFCGSKTFASEYQEGFRILLDPKKPEKGRLLCLLLSIYGRLNLDLGKHRVNHPSSVPPTNP